MSETGWGADFFGGLNAMPPEVGQSVARVLEAMGTEPAFREARRTLLRELRDGAAERLLEAGCGTGVSLPDVVEAFGRDVAYVGVDPTHAFLDAARRRAGQVGLRRATHEVGDIRRLPYPDQAFDAAWCDKVLLHVGPAEAALGELARVVRPGGWVAAIEWQPSFVLSTAQPELAARVAGMWRKAVYDFHAAPNLARYFRAAGLADVRTRAWLAYGERLDEPPFWRAFLVEQIPLFVHAGLLAPEDGQAFQADLEALDAQGAFRAAFVVHLAVARRVA
jgi:ubiquinone/menaquinone biosynthesis C-methylase UbiE